jgi:hypothetical protein
MHTETPVPAYPSSAAKQPITGKPCLRGCSGLESSYATGVSHAKQLSVTPTENVAYDTADRQ